MGLFGSKKPNTEATAGGGEVTLSNGQKVKIARRVDCLGCSCPRPQLMTKKAVNEMSSSDVVEVALDNPSSVEALPPMCDELNATHLETIKASDSWRVYIQKD
ncbi:MAG: sulfurtransferase TusA family protein [Sulfuricella sp.]|nr:sulfurtransferase TusA family protein [Sulfuricella sp.]